MIIFYFLPPVVLQELRILALLIQSPPVHASLTKHDRLIHLHYVIDPYNSHKSRDEETGI